MHAILGRQIALALLFIGCLAGPAFSQVNKVGGTNRNFHNKENKPYYFGITLAFHSSNYKIFRSKKFNEQEQILSVESVTGPGYNVNVISNLKIGRYFDFRLLPGFSFTERNIQYRDQSIEKTIDQKTIESVFVEVPFHARFKSEPYNDMRVFVLGGIKYGFDIASKARRRKDENILKIAPVDFSVEVGFGMQFFFPYFILSPELKYTHGLNNILIFNEEVIQSNVLENVLSRTFTLSFHFEG
ncbi:MAG: PorT family protein [Saprospiraceae bacterium]|nr:PorT family protein [Saprospiraceae bacterium]